MRQGILADRSIRQAVLNGEIIIHPYNPAFVNPASYDLTLGDRVAVYKHWVRTVPSSSTLSPLRSPNAVEDGSRFSPIDLGPFDIKQKPEVETFTIDPQVGWVLKPGIGYLMHTRESVFTEDYVPVLDGKSSIGRLFTQVHITAGYGDPGFRGQYTLEVVVTHPIRVYPGMKFCQIRFHTIASGTPMTAKPEKTYDKVGHYREEFAEGPIPSQAYKQWEDLDAV